MSGADATTGRPAGFRCELGDIPAGTQAVIVARISVVNTALQYPGYQAPADRETISTAGRLEPGGLTTETHAKISNAELSGAEIESAKEVAKACMPLKFAPGFDALGLTAIVDELVDTPLASGQPIDPQGVAYKAAFDKAKELFDTGLQLSIEKSSGKLASAIKYLTFSNIEDAFQCWVTMTAFWGRPTGSITPFQPGEGDVSKYTTTTPAAPGVGSSGDGGQRNGGGGSSGSDKPRPGNPANPANPEPNVPGQPRPDQPAFCGPPPGNPASFHPGDCVYRGNGNDVLTCPSGYQANPDNLRECLRDGATTTTKPKPVQTVKPGITLSRASGPPGTTLTATGKGLAPSQAVTVSESGVGGSRQVGTPSTDASGNLNMLIAIGVGTPEGQIRIEFRQGKTDITLSFQVTK